MSPSVCMFVRNDLRNDTRVWKEARLLRDAGWRVRLVGVRTPGTAGAESREGVELRRVDVRPLDSRLLKSGGAAFVPDFTGSASPGRRGGAKARLRGAMRRRWNPVHERLAEAAFAADAAAAAGPADVYHAHDLNALRPALRLRRKHGGRVVLDAHEFFSERNFFYPPAAWERRLLRWEEGRGCRAADAVVTVSESIADALQSRYGLAARPTVIMNCPPASAAPAAPEPLARRLGVTGPVVIYLGALTWNRGIEQTLAALARLPGVHLALLGPWQRGFRPVVEAAAVAAGVADRLHVLAPVPPDAVVAAAAGADAAVALIQNACLSYYYCSPNKVFEALAAGLPVVASDFPDLRRVLGDSAAGALCAPDDPAAVAAAITAVLARPRSAAREAALALAARYTWESEARKLAALYHGLIEEPVRV